MTDITGVINHSSLVLHLIWSSCYTTGCSCPTHQSSETSPAHQLPSAWWKHTRLCLHYFSDISFEQLVKTFFTTFLPDSLQFAFRPNRSTDDTISRPSTPPSPTWTRGYVNMLFIDCSSPFNSIVLQGWLVVQLML